MGVHRNSDMPFLCIEHRTFESTCPADCKAPLIDPYEFETIFKIYKDAVATEGDRYYAALRDNEATHAYVSREIENVFKKSLVSISFDRSKRGEICKTFSKVP